MLNKKIVLLFVALIAISGSLKSQGGSNYSIFGVGDLLLNNSAYYNGLGGTSIAIQSDNQINTLNPALTATLNTTRLQTGYLFNQNYVNSEKSSLWQNNGKVNGINAVFALDTSLDIAVTFGINPYSNVNYVSKNSVSLVLDTSTTYSGNAYYQGQGGVSQGQIGVSAKIISDLYLGILATYKFGQILTINEVIIDGENTFKTGNLRRNKVSGAGIKMGLYYEPITNLGIGAFYDKSFSTTNYTEYTYSSMLVPDTTFLYENEFDIPPLFGVGLSYKSGKFLFGADYINQDFSNMKFNNSSKFTYQALERFSFGVSRIGNKAFSAEYLDKVGYNFGFGYQNQYYKVGNQSISDMFLSIGLDMPIAGNALINTSFVFGKRGTLNNGLVEEYYGKLLIDFSIGETWFKPFIREY